MKFPSLAVAVLVSIVTPAFAITDAEITFTTGSPVVIERPEITIRDSAGKTLVDGNAKTKFGVLEIGKSSTRKFTVKNSGGAKLSGLVVSVSGSGAKAFAVKTLAKTSLGAGKDGEFFVTFKAKSEGKQSAMLRIKSNDSDEGTFDIKLSGEGLE